MWDLRNTTLGIIEIVLEREKIGEAFDGLKLAHISDLHHAEFGNKQHQLIKKLKDIHPDIIVITGDLIDANRPSVAVAMDFIKIAPVYYCTGNHEARTREYEKLKAELMSYGVIMLDDSKELLRRKDSTLTLIDREDPRVYSSKNNSANSSDVS